MPGPLPGLDGAGPDRVREGAAALHAPPPARVGAYLLYCIVQCILYTVVYSTVYQAGQQDLEEGVES